MQDFCGIIINNRNTGDEYLRMSTSRIFKLWEEKAYQVKFDAFAAAYSFE